MTEKDSNFSKQLAILALLKKPDSQQKASNFRTITTLVLKLHTFYDFSAVFDGILLNGGDVYAVCIKIFIRDLFILSIMVDFIQAII